MELKASKVFEISILIYFVPIKSAIKIYKNQSKTFYRSRIDLDELKQANFFMPSINEFKPNSFMHCLDFYNCQFITGHGKFNDYLNNRKLSETRICSNCQSNEKESSFICMRSFQSY